ECTRSRVRVSGGLRPDRDAIARLERVFHFPTFTAALAFTNRVGALAEAEGHHPALLTEWGRVTVTWWTHKIRGLHRNDFIMAAKTERLATRPVGGSPALAGPAWAGAVTGAVAKPGRR